jgi:hypothetical protein
MNHVKMKFKAERTLARIRILELRKTNHALVASAGALFMAMMSACTFGIFYGGI